MATLHQRNRQMSELYDVIIIGAGPAGLGAGLYTARDRLRTLLLEKYMPGGQ
ncbi:MAG TPA: FAD-binding protein, partial [Phycisphaerales bacterium]|nr:FAD-binding protein [Phycisphaerales bacterium]